MTYREALAWLFGTQKFGIKLGLENIERLLSELKIPRNGDFQIADGGLEAAAPWRIVHIAGTNGKGSVCAMIDSICRAAGYRTGLFTSPHLVTFRERIRVDGEMIGEPEVAHGLTTIRQLVRDWDPHPTFFEITTALGLLHFRERECEVVVLETGMGGRLDATNAVTPAVSVITPIALDHQKWLGSTLAEIAAEKAGIIKPGIPVVSAAQPAEAAAIIGADTFVSESYDRSPIALAGSHQKQNAALALAALGAAQIAVSDRAIVEGLATMNWPARFQRWDERTVIDGAHNPAGADILARTWREIFGSVRASLILAILEDKDAAGICRALVPISARIFLPRIRSARALSPTGFASLLRESAPGLPCSITPDFATALWEARRASDPILIAGSLHFAGEALALLQNHPAAFEECAQ
ncbi:MAG: bifunctional folylpolyglutamate synthase/dihydrofolate synthase [Verrucomicrobiota bacterium]|nr:bifunctional folylpolyglutamate synthase/dihydrofolate synthase [Verrucomicrobiota bacterium]